MKIKILFATFGLLSQANIFAQSEATESADSEFKKADTELNQIYTEVLGRMPNKVTKAKFVESEKAWLNYRDSDAALFAGVTSHGGSAYSMDLLGNLTEITKQRIQELKRLSKLLRPRHFQ